jgi:hypothetical protein
MREAPRLHRARLRAVDDARPALLIAGSIPATGRFDIIRVAKNRRRVAKLGATSQRLMLLHLWTPLAKFDGAATGDLPVIGADLLARRSSPGVDAACPGSRSATGSLRRSAPARAPFTTFLRRLARISGITRWSKPKRPSANGGYACVAAVLLVRLIVRSRSPIRPLESVNG